MAPPDGDRGLEHRRRQPPDHPAGGRLRRRRDRAPDRLPVQRQHPLLCGRLADRGVGGAGAGPGAHRPHPGRPDRGSLRRRARDHACHRADRRPGDAGALAGQPPGDPPGAGRHRDDPGADHHRQRHRHLQRLGGGAGGAAGDRLRLHLRRPDLLAPLRRLLLGHQGVLVRRVHHGDLVLLRLQHRAGGRGGGEVHHQRRRRELRDDPAARHPAGQAAPPRMPSRRVAEPPSRR